MPNPIRIPGYRFLHSPGPTRVPDEVLHAMSRQPMDLGDPRVSQMIEACENGPEATAGHARCPCADVRRQWPWRVGRGDRESGRPWRHRAGARHRPLLRSVGGADRSAGAAACPHAVDRRPADRRWRHGSRRCVPTPRTGSWPCSQCTPTPPAASRPTCRPFARRSTRPPPGAVRRRRGGVTGRGAVCDGRVACQRGAGRVAERADGAAGAGLRCRRCTRDGGGGATPRRVSIGTGASGSATNCRTASSAARRRTAC